MFRIGVIFVCFIFILMVTNGESGPITSTKLYKHDWTGAARLRRSPPPPTWSTRDSANALAAAFSTLKRRSHRGLRQAGKVSAGLATFAMQNGHPNCD